MDTRARLGVNEVQIKKHCELQTLADLKGLERIDGDSVLEAVNYRTLDRNLWS